MAYRAPSARNGADFDAAVAGAAGGGGAGDDEAGGSAGGAGGGGAPLRRSVRIAGRGGRGADGDGAGGAAAAARNPPPVGGGDNPAAAAARSRREDARRHARGMRELERALERRGLRGPGAGGDDDDDAPPGLGNDGPNDGPPLLQRARAAARNAFADVSSDDEDVAFMPGPEPVFKLKKGKHYRSSEDGERNSDHEDERRRCGDDSDDDESSHGWDVDGALDVDVLLHGSSDYSDPSTELWGSYPRHAPDDSDDDGDDAAAADDGRVNIPISWLRTGFKLSPCGGGLAMSSPSGDEWDRSRRSHSALMRDGPLKGVRSLFPYNCKGVSAMLSVVTALLYSGASIRGDGCASAVVSCDADRVPFDELSLEQRRREFDPRLVDALSSLIFVAARAGCKRVEEKLEAYDKQWKRRKGNVSPKEEDAYSAKRISLQRRSRLCQVCWWETTNGTDRETIFPEGKHPRDVNFKTSFTNIYDIKSYVKTHLRSFKEPGGCALLLETILHCHGPSLHLPSSGFLKCKCSESLKHLEECAKKRSSVGDNLVSSVMPEEHDCMSVELLSLLLTGRVHSNYETWSADMFGIGLLRMNKSNTAPICPRLLRPLKPIWICLGETGYSTMFLDTKKLIGSANSLENPGKSLELGHWNCWSGERTGFKVITSMHDERPHNLPSGGKKKQVKQLSLGLIPDDTSDSEEEVGRTVTDSICARLHLELKRDAAMPWNQDGVLGIAPAGASNPDLKPITDEELQALSFHPEDEKYYPSQYRRWRFRFGSCGDELAKMSGVTTAACGADETGWIPFYRLRGRQRLIVEMKLAPSVIRIVRSRWPLATVRDFEPAGKFPLC